MPDFVCTWFIASSFIIVTHHSATFSYKLTKFYSHFFLLQNFPVLGDDLFDWRCPSNWIFRQQLAWAVYWHGRLPRSSPPAAASSITASGDAPAIRVLHWIFVVLLHRASVDQRIHHAVVLDSLRHLPAQGGRPPRLGSYSPRRQRHPAAHRSGHLANACRVSSSYLSNRTFTQSKNSFVFPLICRRILTVRTCDDFYSIMAVLAREMLEFGLMEPNHLVQVCFIRL